MDTSSSSSRTLADDPTLPDLSGAAKRKLEIQRAALVDEFDFAAGHLVQHNQERERQSAERSRGDKWPDTFVDRKGVSSSVSFARRRFRNFAMEYWNLWRSDIGYEVFAQWLSTIEKNVAEEVASFWSGQNDQVDRWYVGVCKPAIEKALAAKVQEFTGWARAAELKHLESGTQPITPDHSEFMTPEHTAPMHANVSRPAHSMAADVNQVTVSESLRGSLTKCAEFWDARLKEFYQSELLTEDWRPNYQEMANELVSQDLWPGNVAKRIAPSAQKDFVKFGDNYFEIRSISLLADSVTSTIRCRDTRNGSAEPYDRIEDLVREVLHEPIQKWVKKASNDAKERAFTRIDLEFGHLLSGITSVEAARKEYARQMAQLRQEELNSIRRDDPNSLLRAHYTYGAERGAFGEWTLYGAQNRRLRDDFTTVARESGRAIGCPVETDPLAYWLHSVLLGILRERSDRFKGGLMGDRQSGLITSVVRSSDEHWSLLNAELARILSPSVTAPSLRSDPKSLQSPTKKERGRPPLIADDRKDEALRMKEKGSCNKEIAAHLYNQQYPTPRQVKNVPSILNHHRRSKLKKADLLGT